MSEQPMAKDLGQRLREFAGFPRLGLKENHGKSTGPPLYLMDFNGKDH